MLRRTNTSNYLYHYTTASKALEFILHDMTLRLGPISRTNDPAEEEFLSPVAGDRSDPDLFFELEDLMARRMLACLSRDRPGSAYMGCDPLSFHGYARDRMWAQYADNHRGVCLFFDRQALESAFRDQMGKNGMILTGPVSYQEEVPLTEAPYSAEEYARIGRTEWLRGRCEAMARERSFVKRADWESEQEYRFVFVPNPSEECRRNPSEGCQCNETISIRGALSAICVGHRFPEGLLPCIRTVRDRERIKAFKFEYIGDPQLRPLDPANQG
jgi:hypothetical protein